MQTVNKGPEPIEWQTHRLTSGADFEATAELKFALLKEGGFVCAYCERRIPCEDPFDNNSQSDNSDSHAATHRTDTMHVEHVYPRKLLTTPAERMRYDNLTACCPGFIGKIGMHSKASMYSSHCDHRKGSRVLHLNIFKPDISADFSYVTNIKKDDAGRILINKTFDHHPDQREMNWLNENKPGWDEGHPGILKVELQNEIGPEKMEHPENVLNINHPYLMMNRAAVIKAITTAAKKNGTSRRWWENALRKFSTMSERIPYLNPKTNQTEYFPAYTPYRSIAIYYIKKQLRQFV